MFGFYSFLAVVAKTSAAMGFCREPTSLQKLPQQQQLSLDGTYPTSSLFLNNFNKLQEQSKQIEVLKKQLADQQAASATRIEDLKKQLADQLAASAITAGTHNAAIDNLNATAQSYKESRDRNRLKREALELQVEKFTKLRRVTKDHVSLPYHGRCP